ncbi:MAG: elongation factor P maturation arginine rhamnosyltransferase EarP [Nitrosomonadales bacterium]|nr:elongation factor P maturation arginine rhamnosyltransferase EarP [Nitrosomonadales bacterium]
MSKLLACDIFCAVVDNYGDIGVCWRLAKQLSNEHGMAVRLWVDDLASFRKLCPEIDSELPAQHSHGVKIRHWIAPFPEVEPAHLVIEAFACELPGSYVMAMAAQKHKPVWLNLEYLSAENWVEGCHKLPSPHPRLPLVKYFFFPGFTPRTGGLLLEHALLARRDAFQRDPRSIAAYWNTLGVPLPEPNETRISMFCYENLALPGLLAAWTGASAPICCLVPEGRALPQVASFFGRERITPGETFGCGNLRVQVLPFVEQERYDELLWACDINFVRGEDSCVRAQWAGRPFVWHIYPQHDGVHMQKLRAFMALYCAGLQPDVTQALHDLWAAWNGEVKSKPEWNNLLAYQSVLQQHAHDWAQQLSGNSLALNLLDFFQKVDRMPASEI